MATRDATLAHGRNRFGPIYTGFVRRVLRVLIVTALAVAGLSACQAPEPILLNEVNVPKDAATLSEAMKLVAPGGLVTIAPGRYKEQLEVSKKDVTIRGEDRNLTIIDGEGIRPYGIVATADGIRIENLTVTGATFYGVLITGMHDKDGVKAPGDDGYTQWLPDSLYTPLQRYLVDHVTAYNNGLYGIYALYAQHGVIKDSYASGSADSGIYVGQCEQCDALVIGNVAERNAVGFENANANDTVIIAGNRFSGNRVGLTLLSSYREAFSPQHGNMVIGNLISNNTEADSPSQAEGGFGIGVGISGGQYNGFMKNRITGNPRSAVILTNTEDISALGNNFFNNVFDGGTVLANLSATRAPAKANCVTELVKTVPVTLATELVAACNGKQAAQSYAESLDGPGSPPGVSFLKVAPPIDQPQLAASSEYTRLPNRVTLPDLSTFSVPDEDFLAELSGTK